MLIPGELENGFIIRTLLGHREYAVLTRVLQIFSIINFQCLLAALLLVYIVPELASDTVYTYGEFCTALLCYKIFVAHTIS